MKARVTKERNGAQQKASLSRLTKWMVLIAGSSGLVYLVIEKTMLVVGPEAQFPSGKKKYRRAHPSEYHQLPLVS